MYPLHCCDYSLQNRLNSGLSIHTRDAGLTFTFSSCSFVNKTVKTNVPCGAVLKIKAIRHVKQLTHFRSRWMLNIINIIRLYVFHVKLLLECIFYYKNKNLSWYSMQSQNNCNYLSKIMVSKFVFRAPELSTTLHEQGSNWMGTYSANRHILTRLLSRHFWTHGPPDTLSGCFWFLKTSQHLQDINKTRKNTKSSSILSVRLTL